MPSTYFSLSYHLIFATKDREPTITPTWRTRLHEYLGATTGGLDGLSLGVGGVADHVHLLVSLKTTHCVADFVRELKKASSVWMSESCGARFSWQEGYAIFTVSASLRKSVQDYIARQEEHHRTHSFRDELIEFLGKSGVAYDARYLD